MPVRCFKGKGARERFWGIPIHLAHSRMMCRSARIAEWVKMPLAGNPAMAKRHERDNQVWLMTACPDSRASEINLGNPRCGEERVLLGLRVSSGAGSFFSN